MFRLIAAGLGILCLLALCFAAGVMWSSTPLEIKSQSAANQSVEPRRQKDEQEEIQMVRRAVIAGFESIGVVKECTRRKEDLTLTVAPSFTAIDAKSKTNVCEMVYCYLMILPREYNLSEYNSVLKLRDSETGKDIGAYKPITGLRLDQQEKPSQK